MMHAPAWLGDASLILVSLLVQGIPFLLLGSFLGALISSTVPWMRVAAGLAPASRAVRPQRRALCPIRSGLRLRGGARRPPSGQKGIPLSAAVGLPDSGAFAESGEHFSAPTSLPSRLTLAKGGLAGGWKPLRRGGHGAIASCHSPSRLLGPACSWAPAMTPNPRHGCR